MSQCEEIGAMTRRPLGKEAEGTRMLETVPCSMIKQESQNGIIGKVKFGQRGGEGPKKEPQSRVKAVQEVEQSLSCHLPVNSDGWQEYNAASRLTALEWWIIGPEIGGSEERQSICIVSFISHHDYLFTEKEK